MWFSQEIAQHFRSKFAWQLTFCCTPSNPRYPSPLVAASSSLTSGAKPGIRTGAAHSGILALTTKGRTVLEHMKQAAKGFRAVVKGCITYFNSFRRNHAFESLGAIRNNYFCPKLTFMSSAEWTFLTVTACSILSANFLIPSDHLILLVTFARSDRKWGLRKHGGS